MTSFLGLVWYAFEFELTNDLIFMNKAAQNGDSNIYLQNKFLKTLPHVDPSFGTTLDKKASISPRKLYSFLFCDNPISFLQKGMKIYYLYTKI